MANKKNGNKVSSPPKYFLYGYYGFKNVGDDLLLAGVISRLLRSNPNSKFIVRSLNSVEGYAKEQVEFLPVEKIMLQTEVSRIRRVWQYGSSIWKALPGCSHLIFGGGTLFHAHKGSSINLALILMIIIMARLQGMSVYVLGVGVANIEGFLSRTVMELILFFSKDFVIRDSSSFENCSRFRCNSRVRKASDLVFNLPLSKKNNLAVPSNKVLGLTLSASDISQDQSAHTKFFEHLGKSLKKLQASGWEIRFLSFQELNTDSIKLSDAMLFTNLSKYVQHTQSGLVSVSSDTDELINQFSKLDVIVGMRFHGHVLAAMLEIPFVGVGRDHKVSDLCEKFSMPFIPMADIDDHNLIEAINLVRDQVPNANIASSMKNAAEMNFDQITE